MEIMITINKCTTIHKYIEDREDAIRYYYEMCEGYGEENVKITSILSRFYV